jgi:hypothetical protein
MFKLTLNVRPFYFLLHRGRITYAQYDSITFHENNITSFQYNSEQISFLELILAFFQSGTHMLQDA